MIIDSLPEQTLPHEQAVQVQPASDIAPSAPISIPRRPLPSTAQDEHAAPSTSRHFPASSPYVDEFPASTVDEVPPPPYTRYPDDDGPIPGAARSAPTRTRHGSHRLLETANEHFPHSAPVGRRSDQAPDGRAPEYYSDALLGPDLPARGHVSAPPNSHPGPPGWLPRSGAQLLQDGIKAYRHVATSFGEILSLIDTDEIPSEGDEGSAEQHERVLFFPAARQHQSLPSRAKPLTSQLSHLPNIVL
jgi:hypothetical protein